MANARALASRMMAEGGGKLESEISHGFRLCTARQPDPKELEKLLAFFHQQEKSFSTDLAAAAKVAGEKAGSLSSRAAMTMLANVLLNLDETLTKE